MTPIFTFAPSEPSSGAIVDVLDGGGLTKLGGGQAACKAAIVSKGSFPVDEQTEPIGMRHLGRLRIVLHLDEGVGHGGEAK